MRILIVDGSRQKRHDLVETLGELTNIVISGAVADTRTALRAIADASPDVVVTGALLPDGEGTTLIERVRRMRTAPSIVVVTPVKSEAQRERYLAAGADHYVDNADELRQVVATLARVCHAAGAIAPIHTLELLGRMTSAVVHDLNNYLGVLELMLALLRRRPDDESLWQQAQAALDAIQRLDATLLAYARGGVPEQEPVDLRVIVNDVVSLAARLIPHDVRVEVELPEEVRPVRAVRSDLEQMVLNLLVNACEAMAKGGVLRILVSSNVRGVLLEVSDTGDGAPAPTTGGRARSSKRRGSGLGLGIVHAVLERYGGAIRVVPRVPSGTLVAVMLPTDS